MVWEETAFDIVLCFNHNRNMEKEMSEAGRQFSEIWEEHNDPSKREERKIKKQREERARIIKEDTGI